MEKVLVVNNDIDFMSLLQNVLERKSFKVVYTSSKAEALEMIRTNPPEIVLVDILHKELLTTLKEAEETNKIPLILITGYSLRDTQSETLADDIIEKPYDPGALVDMMRKEIAISKVRRIG